MTVTMLFTDGQKHEVALRQGDVFVDYIGPIDAPGSKPAEGLTRGKQVRWFTVPVPRKVAVAKLILESPGQGPAPTTVAITADLSEAPIPGAAVVGSTTRNATGNQAAPSAVAVPLIWEAGTKVLVVGGGSSHDFQRWFNTADVATLRAAGNMSVNYTESSATTAKALEDADVVISSTNQRGFDTPELRAALMKFADAGKGIVLLHPAVWYNWPSWPEYNRALVGGGSRGHDAIHEFDVNVVKEHPVTLGLPKSFKATDELYHVNVDTNGNSIEVLAQTSVANNTRREHPSIWLVNHPKARVVAIALGHDGRVHDLPDYKRLLVNAVNWAARKSN
jgi:type 1 glutamine amidotransferase